MTEFAHIWLGLPYYELSFEVNVYLLCSYPFNSRLFPVALAVESLTRSPIWWHYLVIIIPDDIRDYARDAGYIMIGSGDMDDRYITSFIIDLRRLMEYFSGSSVSAERLLLSLVILHPSVLPNYTMLIGIDLPC